MTTTTHKTLRGPRGGMILSHDQELGKKINTAVFPGLQGGPLMHVIAAKAVAFGEALRPEFKAYAETVVENAKALAATLKARGLDIVSGGTDTHLMLVDLRPKALTGKAAEESLGRARLTCNKNGIPFDPEKPTITSGIRLGTPAGTTRGFGPAEFRRVGELIADVLDGLAQHPDDNGAAEAAAREQVAGAVRPLPDLHGPVAARGAEPRRLRRGEGKGAMRCPFCGHDDTQVKDSRPTEDHAAIRRRRYCPACGARWTTFERVHLRELTVVKKNGERAPFDRDKLLRSLRIALRKRPVDDERIERIVNSIQRRLETLGEAEIPSKVIGEMAMDAALPARPGGLRALRLGLPELPRGQGLRGVRGKHRRPLREPSRLAG